MSDYTDDVLDGLFCESCGEFLDEAVGYPRKCEACAADEEETEVNAK